MALQKHPELQTEPLISNRLALKILAVLALMAAATFAISYGGARLGPHLSLGGHTDSLEKFDIHIGLDRLNLTANTIRFREQRKSGPAERVDLYLAWPEMRGYAANLKSRFDDATGTDGLIFLQISQSTMSQDMSGRLEPIYSRLFEGAVEPGPYGLTIHRLKKDSGYGEDVILTAPAGGDRPVYTVRCLMPRSQPGRPAIAATSSSSADCQRDIRAGQDLTVLYRFSSSLLPDWNLIDAAISRFVQERVMTAQNGISAR